MSLQRFQVLLKPEHIEALRAIEQRTGTSMGSLIRLALDDWLSKSAAVKTERKRARTTKRSRLAAKGGAG
jgi:hypothetical protein